MLQFTIRILYNNSQVINKGLRLWQETDQLGHENDHHNLTLHGIINQSIQRSKVEEISRMSKHAEITHDMYRWLTHLQVLPNTLKYKSSGNFELDSKTTEELQSGFLVAKLATNLAAEKSVALNSPLMSSIKNSITPAARIYNWNILHESFLKMDINLPKETQKEITSGNVPALLNFLIEVHLKITAHKKSIEKGPNTDLQSLSLNLKKVRKYEEISSSETLLEFIIILISKHFSLSSKQALATLVESAKLLAHLLVKGVHGSFQEVENFIEEVNEQMNPMMYLAEKEPSTNLSLLLQMFKPTLISREAEVARLGIKLMKSLHYEALKYSNKSILYQLICEQNECFDFVYMGLKRHPDLNQEVVGFLLPLVQDSFLDFIQTQLKRTINNQQQYVCTLLQLFEPMLQSVEGKQLFIKSEALKVLDKNFNAVLAAKFRDKETTNMNEETKILYICLMYEVWLACWQELPEEVSEELLVKTAEELKKSTRSPIYSVKIPALYKLFNLIDCLASHRNKLAGLLYKKVIFLLIEHHHEIETRQIILDNFSLMLSKFPSIPLDLLLEPLLKQLTSKEGTSYILNMHDFQFMLQLCRHPKMDEFYALSFLQYFSRLYTKSIIYSPLIFHIIETVIGRFCESQPVLEQCIKSFHDSLDIYGMIVMGKASNKRSQHPRDKLSSNREQLTLDHQKKALAIELIKSYVRLSNRRVVLEIKETVLALFIDWQRNRGHFDRGLQAVLAEIGDIEQMIAEYMASQVDNQSSIDGFDSKSVRLSPSRYPNKVNLQSPGAKQSRRSPNLKSVEMGDKEKRSALNNHEQMVIRKAVKPNPKTLEDIEKIKEKWKSGVIRSKALKEESKREKVWKLNEKELLQRNLSLGYSKLPNYQQDQILFDFDQVRKTHLKDCYEPICLEAEESRDGTSAANILQCYKKYLGTLFNKYASKSVSMQHQTTMLSFTEMMRFLKEKSLLSLVPKVTVSEIISTINQKRRRDQNILGGIYQEDFEIFLIYLTDCFLQCNPSSRKDEPFGLKMQKIILKMLESESCSKELFDPKLQALRKSVAADPQAAVPQGYKKVNETQIHLITRVKHPQLMNIDRNYLNCMEVVGEILEQALGISVISPFTDLLEQSTVFPRHKVKNVRLIPQSTQKCFAASRLGTGDEEQRSVNKSPNNKSLYVPKNLLKKGGNTKSFQRLVPLESPQGLGKEKKRQFQAKRLKEELQRLREEKKKKQEQKQTAHKLDQERDRKKEDSKKQYLQENRRKIQEAKKKAEEQSREAQDKQQQEKTRRKRQLRAKGAELLQKERKNIREQHEKMVQKAKQQEYDRLSKEKIIRNLSKERGLSQQRKTNKQGQMNDSLISRSLQDGQLGHIVTQHRNPFTELYEGYWIWDKQKMDLKGFAELLKDFKVSQEYVSTKTITEVFKSVAKGQFLNFDGFVECIAKLAYKSQPIKSKCRETGQKQANSQQQGINSQCLKHMIALLRLGEKNYKHILSQVRGQEIR